MRWPWSKRLKVFGIGLNKTGTTTLGACLKNLGYRHCSYRRDLLEAFRDGDSAAALRFADRFDSFEDWPWPLLFRELHAKYGEDARFVLTLRRNPEVWLESLKKHALRTPPYNHARKLAYGHDYPHGYEAEHLGVYERHKEAVRDYFTERKHLLLEVCWEDGDGWEKLCGFLGHPVPDAPFPHAFSASEADERAVASHFEINRQMIDAQLARIAAKKS